MTGYCKEAQGSHESPLSYLSAQVNLVPYLWSAYCREMDTAV